MNKEIARLYYEEGASPLTDEEWDNLGESHEVGYTPTNGVKHLHQLFSLKKVFELDEVTTWIGEHEVVETPKLDGACISIVYEGGQLIRATTRGNGKEGVDITEKARVLAPQTITQKALCQIDGEVIAPDTLPNARNFAAGALNLKSLDEFKERAPWLEFVVHDIRPHCNLSTWSAKMEYCTALGFNTDIGFDSSKYPQDGIVYRIDNLKIWEDLGNTSHHPRGSLAYKVQKAGVVTELLDIIWQTGKSGVVTPVALLEPVMIGDAQVARATLHNTRFIEGLGLELGCEVEVIRSGEIIPRILRRHEQKKFLTSDVRDDIIDPSISEETKTRAVVFPHTCGSCGTKLLWKGDQLFCQGTQCPAKTGKRIEHFAKTLKIKGLGPRTVAKLQLTEICEIYELTCEDLTELLSSYKLADKLFKEIEHSKKANLNQLLPAFGIPLVGKTATEKLSTKIECLNDLTEDECFAAGLGTKTTESLMTWFYNEWKVDHCRLPFDFKFESKVREPTEIKGVVCISGRLNSFKTKAEAATQLSNLGYVVKDNLTKDVTILVNESGKESAKTTKARESGVRIVTNLFNFIGE